MGKAPYLAIAAALVGATACDQTATTPIVGGPSQTATIPVEPTPARATAPGFGSKPVVLQFRGTSDGTPDQVPNPEGGPDLDA